MIKKVLFCIALATIQLQSIAHNTCNDSIDASPQEACVSNTSFIYDGDGLGWDSNWFLGGQYGSAMLLGTPIGCGDMFDRIMPSYTAYIGKWITPTVGLRCSLQGLRLKDCELQKFKYASAHVDFLYNIASHFHEYGEKLPRWDLVPYIGLGVTYSNREPGGICVCNNGARINHPFTFAYGIQLQYRLSNRAHVTGEIAGLTTYESFDGKGSAASFGDNVLSLSLGLSYTIGKVGFLTSKGRHPIDNLKRNNHDDYMDQTIVSRPQSGDNDNYKARNSYSGLNSLRARLNKSHNARGLPDNSFSNDSAITVGTPVYFFFRINTAELINDSQLINIDEIAKLMKKRNLRVRITGAADSATGSEEFNRQLSAARARRIAKELKDRGVDIERLKGSSFGGIDTYEPTEANRFTKVVLTE